MSDQQQPKQGLRERRRASKAAKGDSPEKQAMSHGPKPDVMDKWLRLSGVERERRFKKD
jgi:hypothetical protein